MSKEEIATTYEEYKNGAKQVAGLGRLGCYQGLYYLNKLLEEDKYYSEKLEDSIVFIESHINRIEKENQKYKEVIDKATNELFILKDMIYKPETREENFEIQRKISSIIKRLNGKEVSE